MRRLTQRHLRLKTGESQDQDFSCHYEQSSRPVLQFCYQIGKLYFSKGNTEKAKEIFSKTILDYPKEAELCANARFYLASCYEKEGNSQKTIEELKNIRKDYPHSKLSISVPFHIARHHFINNHDKEVIEAAFNDAITEYEVISQDVKNASLQMEAARLISLSYIVQKRWQEAIDALSSFVSDNSSKPEAELFLFNIALIYQNELNDLKKAASVYKEIIKKYPQGKLLNLSKMRLDSLDDDNYIEQPVN